MGKSIEYFLTGKEFALPDLCSSGGVNMNRITIFMENAENGRLLKDWLLDRYDVTIADIGNPLNGPFDLGILDGPALQKLWNQIEARRKSEEPAFLPFLLVTPRNNLKLVTRSLWQVVDELIMAPIEKIELQARLEILLRARRLSIEAKQRNEDLEALVQAMTHDFRAYLRVILGFTRALREDQMDELGERGLHYLERIQSEGKSAQDLADMLLSFLRLGREGIRKQPVHLQSVIEHCLSDLKDIIQTREVQATVQGELPEVLGDPVLVKMALQNLLSNAIEYVAPGIKPQFTISATTSGANCQIRIQDNGIGIDPENQKRIFQPFVRLHGIEEYPGTGLGLSAARKAAELMGGSIGLESKPEKGSTFWVELPRNNHEISDHR